jgi:hypothetical protein
MRARSEAGAVAVLAMLFVVGVAALVAASFNIGYMLKARGDLQSASDSAALAAAGSIDGTINGLTTGRTMAGQFAAQHRVTGQTVLVDQNADVEYGFWHYRSEPCAFSGMMCGIGFELTTTPTSDPFTVNAVRVNNGRDGDATHNPAISPFLAGFFPGGGGGPYRVRSDAVAVGRRSQVDCSLPIAIANCRGAGHLFTATGELDCGGPPREMTFTNTHTQDLGWIEFFDDNNPNTADLERAILDNDADCAAHDIRTGNYPVSNGNNLNPLIEPLLGYRHNQRQATGCILGVRRTMAVVDNCDSGTPSFNQRKFVIGFVTTEITAISCPNGTTWSVAGPNNCGTRPTRNPCAGGGGGGGGGGTSESLTIRVYCDPPPTNAGGAGSFLHLVR